MQKVAARYEAATGKKFDCPTYVFGRRISDTPEPTITKERLAEIKEEMEKYRMGFRPSGCPQCGYGLYEDQIILEQRIVSSDDRGCTILETRKCKACDHRYSVEMQYNLAGERFVRNEHKKATLSDYAPVFGIDWSKE